MTDEYVPEAEATVYELARDRSLGGEPDELHLTYERELWRLRRENDALRAKVKLQEEELIEEYDLRDRMTDLLTGVAYALKGDPGQLHMHDWSDLPALAAEMAGVVAAAVEYAEPFEGYGDPRAAQGRVVLAAARLQQYRAERAR
jgi:hypothetical protein